MIIELKNYIVAFVDLLGFAAMVAHDCETPKGEQKFINALYASHLETKNLRENHPDLQLIQFSDSVVFSLPYSVENYCSIIKIVADYQFSLLGKGILCRGGLSYGKHFSTEDFLFSLGMIDAYRLESQAAITPRVIISNELQELVKGFIAQKTRDLPISMERDGLFFINYLANRDEEDVWTRIKMAVPSNLNRSSSIRNKQIWLIDFFNHVYPNNDKNTIIKQFSL